MGRPGVADTKTVLNMVDGREVFLRFCQDGRFGAYHVRVTKRVSDEDALEVARDVLEGLEPVELKKMTREKRDAALRSLRTAGMTVKQIERLTGIGHNTISRATKG